MGLKHEIVKEYHPFITPDSLRQATKLMKALYESHTPTNMGFTDIEGLQYTSTIQNFGFELLSETKKIRMDKPPIEKLYEFYDVTPNISNGLTFFFDLRYSEMLEHPSQQNMMVASLKDDILIDGYSYRLLFTNGNVIQTWRSKSYGDDRMYAIQFYHTKTPPVFEECNDTGIVRRYNMSFMDQNKTTTHYYFQTDQEDVQDVIIELDHHNQFKGVPLIWICSDAFRSMPSLEEILSNNQYEESVNSPIFDIGVNGHDQYFLIKHIYENSSSYLNKKWFMKVFTNKGIFSTGTDQNINYNIPISKIEVYSASEFNTTPDSSYHIIINIDESFSKVMIHDITKWNVRKPIEDDYGYDGTTYNNPIYMWTELNEQWNPIDGVAQPLLRVIFDDTYVRTYETLCEDAVSGIHIDNGSDHSYNSIIKKNGMIHNLADFDGLPVYYKYRLSNKILHPRMTIYNIRDQFNQRNQKITKKKVSGIILDAAIPQTSLSTDTSELDEVIVYKMNKSIDEVPTYYFNDNNGKLRWTSKNALSEITFVDNQTFSNSNLLGQSNKPKFIYHGNRTFSLGVMKLDPEKETGRVFILSNDDIKYYNNGLVNDENKKPRRTFARICDIPTSFTQLIHIPNYAPTVIIDEKYMRTECSYDMTTPETIWNGLASNWLKNPPTLNHQWFHYPGNRGGDLNTWMNYGDALFYYSRWINLNPRLNLNNDTEYQFEVVNGGSGFEETDTFTFMIGGRLFDGIVNAVNNGSVTDITVIIPSDETILIPIGNLNGKKTVFNCNNVENQNASGLKISLTIPDEIWDEKYTKKRNGISLPTYKYPHVFYTFKIDEYGFTWAWEMDIDQRKWVKSSQMTGILDTNNAYDDSNTKQKRTVNAVIMDSMLMNHETNIDHNSYEQFTSSIKMIDYQYQPDELYYDKINELNINIQDGLYYIQPTENEYANIVRIERNDEVTIDKLPQFHHFNLNGYKNKACRLHYQFDNEKQPEVYIYNPNQSFKYDYETISATDVVKTKNHQITFNDYNDGIDTIITSGGNLKYDIYQYNEYEMKSELITLYSRLQAMSRENLIKHIKMNLSHTAEPLTFDDDLENIINGYYQSLTGKFFEDVLYTKEIIPDTDHIYVNKTNDVAYRWDIDSGSYYVSRYHVYSNEKLIDYIMMNTYPEYINVRNDITIFRRKGEQVIDDSVGIGLQPRGDFQIASSNIYSKKGYLNTTSVTTELLYCFSFDPSEEERINDLSDFRIFDQENNDISQNTLLIFHKEMYVFDRTWKKVIRK